MLHALLPHEPLEDRAHVLRLRLDQRVVEVRAHPRGGVEQQRVLPVRAAGRPGRDRGIRRIAAAREGEHALDGVGEHGANYASHHDAARAQAGSACQIGAAGVY